MATLQISRLRFEHHPTGLGVDVSKPRLSWAVEPRDASSVPAGWTQSRYDIEIQRGGETSSFNEESTETVLVPWPGAELKSQEQASVRVRSLGSGGVDSEWSEWANVEAALLSADDLTAEFITLERTDEKHPEENGHRPVIFRKKFTVQSSPERSRLYITALGLYEARINGKRVGDECLAPGWTAYQHRISYQTFDVAALLQDGENELIIEVAEGWYSGRIRWEEGETDFYGEHLAAFAQLDLFESGGGKTRVQTDASWEAHISPTVAAGIYDGETYDMRIEDNALPWAAVKVIDKPKGHLEPSRVAPIRITQTVKPVAITHDPDGKALVDFGQNLVGRVVIPSLTKPSGHRITIRHAEVLEKNGYLGVRPLRAAKCIDNIIFGNSQTLKDWYPRFTYHGFRYIELTGWNTSDTDAPLTLESLSAEVMHTDMLRTGHFSCSDSRLNQLHENVVWSMRGNFVGIPTDCPQRDERLGWTGDIQVFCPTASYLFDSGGMLANWMRDVLAEQNEDNGIVPLVVPNAMKTGPWPAVPQAVWDDVVILLPWVLYNNFGDLEILKESWQGMKDYLGSIQRSEDGLWSEDLWQLGDWLDPNAPPQDPGLARTDGVLVADAYLVHVTQVMADIAHALGLQSERDHFNEEAAKLNTVFNDKYMARSGLLAGDSQTALALSLVFNLHETKEQRDVAAKRLVRLVRFANFRVSTGFAGTPVVLDALSAGGFTDVAYRMLLEEECPSWLYPVSKGATTIWERWDSMLEDGSINPGQMTSFNHYALGSVVNWMHAKIGGISPLTPGWKSFRVRPEPGGTITSGQASFLSANGRIECSWELKDGKVEGRVVVPPNTEAVIEEPGVEVRKVGAGEHTFGWAVDEEKTKQWPPKPLLTQFRDMEL